MDVVVESYGTPDRTGIYWTSDVERRCVSIPNNLNNNFCFVSLFHFYVRCLRVFGEEMGKDPEEGREGEGQLNGGCLVSIMRKTDFCFYFFFFRVVDGIRKGTFGLF
jgi:hypothetical protein